MSFRETALRLVEMVWGWCGVAARSLARRHVPELDCVVMAPRGQRLAVGAVRHGTDPVRMSLDGGLDLPCFDIPELDRLVPAPRGQRLAVRAESHGEHPVLEGGLDLAR